MYIKNMGATIKSLEVQIGQLASSINAYQRGKFPSDTEVNPKEQCKAITLRSRKEIEGARKEELVEVNPTSLSKEENTDNEKEEHVEKPPEIKKHKSIVVPEISMPKPALPYPQRFQKKKMDAQLTKFLDIFKKIHINILFADALEQMPNYVKFLKDI